MWRDDLRLQLASPNIYTCATYLQHDRLIAAGSSDGRVLIYDLRMGNKSQVQILGELNTRSFHSKVCDETIIKIAAHPQHPILVTAGADGNIKVFSSLTT
ncbi:MAG: hypothetical protein EZS28_024992 [Streblomastix strix]|uniref:Uncharacterized protein n=1 Tax=Streblomastix strix TaxID=222440 RepID=A0A5J4VAL0_9EUKA|nr:MAG: hypothetical protein EZS28_024992 [Streblomastix strix]